MDSISPVAIKDQLGNDIGPGALTIGQYVELIYDGTNWILISQSGGGTLPQCGRLQIASATALSFVPFNGDRIKIAGILYPIPAAGITGLGNTGIYLNGVAAQNLAANTLYYVYAFLNAGVITGDFSTTGHATSATAGNIGTEIKSGDDSRSLIGMIYTSGSSGFVNAQGTRYVMSWFNRRNIAFGGTSTSRVAISSGSLVELTSAARAYFVAWADEALGFSLSGAELGDAVGALLTTAVMLDGVALYQAPAHVTTANYLMPVGSSGNGNVTEGLHYLTPAGAVSAANGTFYISVNGILRG